MRLTWTCIWPSWQLTWTLLITGCGITVLQPWYMRLPSSAVVCSSLFVAMAAASAAAGARRMGLLALIPFLSSSSSEGNANHSQEKFTGLGEAGKVVKEPFTGIEFQQHKQIDDADYHLHATAVRCMLGQCKMAMARAYAVGLYTEDRQPITETAVLTGGMRRSLVLVMDKDVAGHHIAKGFDRSLLPRIRQAQAGSKRGSGKDALRDFTTCFNQQKMLRKGSEVALLWTPDDKLVIHIDNQVKAVIVSPILCRAVFDMYLGHDSIFRKYRNMSFTFYDNSMAEA